MKIWIVLNGDYDSDWPTAAYQTEALANEHASELGGWVSECDLLDALHPDATDPDKQRQRAAEMAAAKTEQERIRRIQEEQSRQRAEMKPRPPHINLCHCWTVQLPEQRRYTFLNEYGYCGYCGGFDPPVFLKLMGAPALLAEIDKLAIDDRERMRGLVAERLGVLSRA